MRGTAVEQPRTPETRAEKEAFSASPRLQMHIAQGNFDATPNQNLPSEITQASYQALEAQHDKLRGEDNNTQRTRLDKKLDQDEKNKHNFRVHLQTLKRNRGQDPTVTDEEVYHYYHMIEWAGTEAARIGVILSDESQLETRARIFHEKLGINVMSKSDGVRLSLFNHVTNEPGEFYNTFCTGDTNGKLANALSVEQMYAIKPFIKDLLGDSTDTAFNALVALRQTKEALKDASQQQALTNSVNSLLPATDTPVLDYYRAGWAMVPEEIRSKPIETPKSVSSPLEPTSTTEESKITEIKREIFDKAGKRTETEAVSLIQSVEHQLEEEKIRGKGKIKGTTVQEVAQNNPGSEVIHDGHVVYIPRVDGDMYILGDLHGDFATFRDALESQKIIEQLESNPHTHIVLLGDLVDRGYKQIELMEAILALKQRYGDRITILKADHEEIEGENVSSHDFPMYVAKRYITSDTIKPYIQRVQDRLIRDMSNPNSQYGKKLIKEGHITETQKQQTTTRIMEITLKVLSGAALTKEDRMFQAEFPQVLYTSQDIVQLAGKESQVYKEYQHLFSLLPRFVVTANGIALSHGGPSGTPYSLEQLASIISTNNDYSRQIFDSQMTWGDPVRGDTKPLEEKKQQVVQDLEKLLREDPLSDTIMYQGFSYKRSFVESTLQILKQFPTGIYPNPIRVEDDDYLVAAHANFIQYDEQGITREMGVIGVKVWARAHQEVPDGKNIFWNGKIATYHTTGKGSPDSAYTQPRVIGKFSLNDDIQKIEESNVVRL